MKSSENIVGKTEEGTIKKEKSTRVKKATEKKQVEKHEEKPITEGMTKAKKLD